MARLLDVLFSNGVTLADLGSLRIGRGETLIAQGGASDAIFFVVAGRLRAERDGHTIGYIEAGSVVGDIGFFTGTARTATVIAFRDSLVLRLTRSDYDSHCARYPDLQDGIITELAARFAERFQAPDAALAARARPRTVALLAAGGGALPEGFAGRLCAAASRSCAARTVGRDRFRHEAAGVSPDSHEAVDWFSRTERGQDLTLYLPEPDDPGWQRAIVSQSDQVVLVGRAGPPPPLSPDESFALDRVPAEQRRLVLIHPRRRHAVGGTGDWLRSRPAAMHHHLSLAGEADIRRLARFLSGSAVGLVLAGGGAYGVAHVGVHAALSAEGIGFDILGGTSVGSAMSAAFALGIAGEELAGRIAEIFVRGAALRRLTLPRYALLDHRAFDDRLAEHFGTVDIADLWLPYFAVATDLDRKRPEVIRNGPLWQAIRASSAIPGVLPPFIRADGTLLVDGGILDNLPWRAMHEIKAGPNVLVALPRATGRSDGYAYDRIPGRGGLLLELMGLHRRRAPPAPGVTETIIRSMLAGQSVRPGSPGAQDWTLAPPLPDRMGFMNWKDAFALIAPAAEHARAACAALAASDPPRWGALGAAGRSVRRAALSPAGAARSPAPGSPPRPRRC